MEGVLSFLSFTCSKRFGGDNELSTNVCKSSEGFPTSSMLKKMFRLVKSRKFPKSPILGLFLIQISIQKIPLTGGRNGRKVFSSWQWQEEERLSSRRSSFSCKKKLTTTLRKPVQHIVLKEKQNCDNNTKGSIYLLEGNYEEAIKYFNKKLRKNPKNLPSLFNKGAALLELRKYQESLEIFQNLLKLNLAASEKADAYSNIGYILESQGKSENALERFKKAVEADPQHIEAMNNAANILCKLGRFSEAEEYYRKSLQIAPDDCNTLYDLGNTLQSQIRYERPMNSTIKQLKFLSMTCTINTIKQMDYSCLANIMKPFNYVYT